MQVNTVNFTQEGQAQRFITANQGRNGEPVMNLNGKVLHEQTKVLRDDVYLFDCGEEGVHIKKLSPYRNDMQVLMLSREEFELIQKA